MRPRKNLICVDDNEQILSVRSFLLTTRGYNVAAFTSADQALAFLSTAPIGSVDLLISDLRMPGIDGNELVRRAKAMHPMLPAMIVSGRVATFECAGYADAFLPKGYSVPDFLYRVKTMCERKRGPKKWPVVAEARIA